MSAGRVDLNENTVDLTYTSTVEGFDLDRAVVDLAQLRAVKQALGIWENELTEWIAEALGRNETDVEGVGHVQVKRGVDRKEWDRQNLLRAVLDSRMAPDPETGETDPTDDGHADVGGEAISCSPDLSRVLHVWNVGAPRVTALRDRGIDPDEFCASSPGKTSVVIT